MTDVSKVFFESGIFKDVANEAQVAVKILAGAELGLSPIQSMNSVYIIHGKVGYEVKVFLGKIKAEKVYDYDVQFDHNDNGAVTNATVTFFKIEGEQRRELGKASFGLKEAARTGLINKDLYKSYPKLMMYYRAASDGIKMYCPDVIKGAVMREDLIEIETVPSKVTMEKKEQENGKETI